MKNISCCIIFILCIYYTKAQTSFTIPDSNFFNAILQAQPSFSNCVLDTSTRTISISGLNSLNITTLNVSNKNISNLDGIQYFTNLTNLDCNNNQLDSLPSLPNSLTTLKCYSNQLTRLPNTLPTNLLFCECNNNQLDSLPPLPLNLVTLKCYSNNLTHLPTTLPTNLTYFDCSYNQLDSLPSLPNSITNLDCNYNQLDSLPSLPSNLTYLNCGNNQLKHLSTNLPTTLVSLDCSFNQIKYIPVLPNNLEALYCGNNEFLSLPVLSDSLKTLECNNNQLTHLPTLSNKLITLKCNNNQLSGLPTLPNNLNFLDCSSNQVSCLPTLPESLGTLDFFNTNITCLPNYTNNITSPNYNLPLCSAVSLSPCTMLSTEGNSEVFTTELAQIIYNDTLYLPFTTSSIDTISYKICVFYKNATLQDTLVIFDGDGVLGKPRELKSRYGNIPTITKWEGKIPYNPIGISDSIRKAIMYFNVQAGLLGLRIAFVPKENNDTDYITFVHRAKSYASYIGRIGGEQNIWVDTAGFSGKILHEMTHVLGLYHEHQRDSAQDYVSINTNYIRAAFADAFCKIHDIQTTPYDYNSIMHYNCYAFSIFPPLDGVNLGFQQNTIIPIKNMGDKEMGQRASYTNYDIDDINELYPDGIIGGVGPTGIGLFTLLLPSYQNIDSVSWSIYNTEPVGNASVAISSTAINDAGNYQVTVNVPAQTANAPRGFVVATIYLNNGQQKKFYKYVYKN